MSKAAHLYARIEPSVKERACTTGFHLLMTDSTPSKREFHFKAEVQSDQKHLRKLKADEKIPFLVINKNTVLNVLRQAGAAHNSLILQNGKNICRIISTYTILLLTNRVNLVKIE